MDRIAPKPPFLVKGKHIDHILPAQLTERLTPVDNKFSTTSMGIPEINVADWRLDITGLIDSPLRFSFDDLKRFPKRTLETVYVCSGNPAKPTVPLRRAANVIWGGVDLALLLSEARIKDAASHLWAYGLDYGQFMGVEQQHYLKDMPLSRFYEGDVLVAYELNGAPLTPKNGFPARLVIPGFYGTNNVKWLCRLELSDRRAESIMTTSYYNDTVFDEALSVKITKPVWAIAPECVFVSPAPKSEVACVTTEVWGWAWSNCEVQFVEVSTDGGETWAKAVLEPRQQLSWQKFAFSWMPPDPGTYTLMCRATDVKGDTQPADGARNSVYAVTVTAKK